MLNAVSPAKHVRRNELRTAPYTEASAADIARAVLSKKISDAEGKHALSAAAARSEIGLQSAYRVFATQGHPALEQAIADAVETINERFHTHLTRSEHYQPDWASLAAGAKSFAGWFRHFAMGAAHLIYKESIREHKRMSTARGLADEIALAASDVHLAPEDAMNAGLYDDASDLVESLRDGQYTAEQGQTEWASLVSVARAYNVGVPLTPVLGDKIVMARIRKDPNLPARVLNQVLEGEPVEDKHVFRIFIDLDKRQRASLGCFRDASVVYAYALGYAHRSPCTPNKVRQAMLDELDGLPAPQRSLAANLVYSWCQASSGYIRVAAADRKDEGSFKSHREKTAAELKVDHKAWLNAVAAAVAGGLYPSGTTPAQLHAVLTNMKVRLMKSLSDDQARRKAARDAQRHHESDVATA